MVWRVKVAPTPHLATILSTCVLPLFDKDTGRRKPLCRLAPHELQRHARAGWKVGKVLQAFILHGLPLAGGFWLPVSSTLPPFWA
jgi:hypothetical protein